MKIPMVMTAALIPIIWPLWVSLTSPPKETERMANHREKAGQSAK